MRALLRAVTAVVALAASCVAWAQEELGVEHEGAVVVEVRTGVTPFDEGDALPEAHLARVTPGESPSDGVARAVVTGAHGRVEFEGADDGRAVLVWAAGHAPKAFLSLDHGDVLALEPERVLRGVVVSGTERLPGVRVTARVSLPVHGSVQAYLDAHRYVVTATTDAEGRFELVGLADEPVELSLEATGHVTAQLFPVDPDPTASERRREFELVRTGALTGVCTLHPGGEPLAGAVVLVADRVTVTDDDGSFRIGELEPGVVTVRVDGDRVVATEPLRVAVAPGDAAEGTDEVRIAALMSSGIELRLTTSDGTEPPFVEATLTWPVTAGTALPVGVSVDGRERVERSVAALRGPDGVYSLPDLLPADGLALALDVPGFAPLRLEGLSLPVGGVVPLEVLLDRGGNLVGQVVSPDGVPIAAARVEVATAPRPAGVVVREGVVAPDGSFSLGSLPGGSLWLQVVPLDGGPVRSTEFGPFLAGVGEPMDVGTLALAPGLTLAGEVVGLPTAAESALTAVARVGDRDLTTAPVGGDGAFELHGLPPGELEIQVRGVDGRVGARAVALLPEPAPLRLHWREVARLTGIVVGADGELVRTARVQAHAEPRLDEFDRRPTEELPPPVTTELRNAAGRFELPLSEGDWTISAWTGDGRSAAVSVTVGREPTDVRLVVEQGETLRGHVFDAETALPVAGASVRFVPAHDRRRPGRSAVTDAEGWFELPGVEPGVLRAVVRADGFAPYVGEPVVVRRAAGLHLGRIELDRGVTLRGVLTAETGAPLAGAIVTYQPLGAARVATTSDLFGRFEFPLQPPGDGVLRLAEPQVERRVTIPAGLREHEVLLDVGRGTALNGRVTWRGRDVPLARITVWTLGEDVRRAETRADAFGRFELPPLTPGPLAVEVQAPGRRAPWKTRLLLPEGGLHTVDLGLPEGRLTGRVIADRDGRPVAGAFVRLYSRDALTGDASIAAEAVTDGSGRFEVEGVEAGRYEVHASREDHGTDDSQVVRIAGDGSTPPVDLRLAGDSAFVARIVDARLEPVPGAWLAARRPDRRGVGLARTARADATGQVRLGELGPGLWAVSAGAPGLGAVDLGVRELREETFDLGETVLEVGGTLEIEVVGRFLRPLAGAYVRIEDVFGRDPRVFRRVRDPLLGGDERFRTDGQGFLLLPGLPVGTYRLRVSGDAELEPVVAVIRERELTRVLLVGPPDAAR